MAQQAVKVISSQGNIFTLQQSASSFRNLLTRQNFPTDVSQKILNCLSDGAERYKVFHRGRFVEKSKNLIEVIHKGPFIKYVRKIFGKTNISKPLVRTRTNIMDDS